MGPQLRPPASSVGWPLAPSPAQNLKGNEYFQYKANEWLISLQGKWLISLQENEYCREMSIFSRSKDYKVPTWYESSIYMCCSQLTASCSTASMYFADRKIVNDFVAKLFSQGQFNVSGSCCRNVGVGQQDNNVLVELKNWCRSNRHVDVHRMAFN